MPAEHEDGADPLKLAVLARGDGRVAEAWDGVRRFLEDRPDVRVLAAATGCDLPHPPREAEICVVLGGDGAMLRACRTFGTDQVPLLGVNLGRLGFLADLSPEEFFDRFDELAARRFEVRQHLMFRVRLKRGGEYVAGGDGQGGPLGWLGLNELAITSRSFHMIEVRLEIDGLPVTTYNGDGLLVSTPVGSTAHNLSAGGPILRQDLRAFVVTPVCPHTLSVRPLVDVADAVYTLTLQNDCEGAVAVVDGQTRLPLSCGDVVEFAAAEVSCPLVKLPGASFYAALHNKLGWDGQPHYRR